MIGSMPDKKPSRIDPPPVKPSPGSNAGAIPPQSITIILGRMAEQGKDAGGASSARLNKDIASYTGARGGGTPLAEYMGPEAGPFDCEHCKHFEDGGLCNQPTVIKDPDLKKRKGKAIVDAKGCCRFFQPEKAEEEKN